MASNDGYQYQTPRYGYTDPYHYSLVSQARDSNEQAQDVPSQPRLPRYVQPPEPHRAVAPLRESRWTREEDDLLMGFNLRIDDLTWVASHIPIRRPKESEKRWTYLDRKNNRGKRLSQKQKDENRKFRPFGEMMRTTNFSN